MYKRPLWDSAGTYIEENILSVYIKRLRDKIEDDPSRPELIQTVRGLGYKAVSYTHLDVYKRQALRC